MPWSNQIISFWLRIAFLFVLAGFWPRSNSSTSIGMMLACPSHVLNCLAFRDSKLQSLSTIASNFSFPSQGLNVSNGKLDYYRHLSLNLEGGVGLRERNSHAYRNDAVGQHPFEYWSCHFTAPECNGLLHGRATPDWSRGHPCQVSIQFHEPFFAEYSKNSIT